MSPHEALQHELVRRTISEPGDPALNDLFQTFNARHFQGGLPSIPVRWEPDLAEVGSRAPEPFKLEGMYGRLGQRAVILLEPGLQGDRAALARVLSHEMVHAYLAKGGDSSADHGPAFQTVLRRLSAEGAFEGVLASEDERVNLRVWIDAESARLESERDLLTRLASEIETERLAVEQALGEMNARIGAANAAGRGWPAESETAALTARRDACNERAAATRDRAERDRDDVEHFNREVARYNLMLVYPDGLDTRARVAPKAGMASHAEKR